MTWLVMGSIRTTMRMESNQSDGRHFGMSSWNWKWWFHLIYIYRVVFSFTADTPNQFVCGEFIGNWIGPSASTHIQPQHNNNILSFFPRHSIPLERRRLAQQWTGNESVILSPLWIGTVERAEIVVALKREKGRRDPYKRRRKSITTCIGYSAAAAAAADGV